MYGQMVGWRDSRPDGWSDGWPDECSNKRTDSRLDGLTVSRYIGQTEVHQMKALTVRCTDGWLVGWMDRRLGDGRTDCQMDRLMVAQTD